MPDSDSSRCLATGSPGSIEQANYRAGLGAANLKRVAGGHLSRAFDKLAVLGANSHTTVNTSTDGWNIDTTLSMLVTVHAYSSQWVYSILPDDGPRVVHPQGTNVDPSSIPEDKRSRQQVSGRAAATHSEASLCQGV